MKYLHMERIPVHLTVMSPLFIGGGQALDINKKNSVRLKGKPYLLIPDENRLITELDRLGLLDAYERFLLGPATASLGEFFAQHGMEADEYAPWVSYLLECRDDQINTLKPFIKLPDGLPYIPGSAIKGAMRTAYLAFLMKDTDRQKLLENMTNHPTSRQASGEEAPLRLLDLKWNKRTNQRENDPVNDLLKGLAVSDSSPIGRDALVVARKLDFKSTDASQRAGRMPLLWECLCPGTETAFHLSLDTGIFPLHRLEELKQALRQRHETLLARYDAQFGEDAYTPLPLPDGALPITLGAGTGFQTKTLLYAISDSEKVRYTAHKVLHAQFFNEFKKKGTYPVREGSSLPAPYCFKRTEYHGLYYPFGRCAISLGD